MLPVIVWHSYDTSDGISFWWNSISLFGMVMKKFAISEEDLKENDLKNKNDLGWHEESTQDDLKNEKDLIYTWIQS